MIGQLSTRLALETAQETADDFGGAVISWILQRHVWGKIMPRAPQERSENGRLSVTQSYRVVIRYRRDFPERARLIWGERVLRIITASDPDNRRERLHLICEEEHQ